MRDSGKAEHRVEDVRLHSDRVGGPQRVDWPSDTRGISRVRGKDAVGACFLLLTPHLPLRQYALGDFAVRQAGIALKKSRADIDKYANRSMNFMNMWDPSVTSDGFSGFAQRRFTVPFFNSALHVSC